MIAKYIILSNTISVLSDNILRICIQEPLLILKRFIVRLHTLSAYNSLLVRYKVYSSDRECLCTSWRYAEAYENISIDPAACRKNPIKKLPYWFKLSAPTTRRKLHWNKRVAAKVFLVWFYFYEKLHWNKSVTAKVSLKNLVRYLLKESTLWNRIFKSTIW